MSDWISVKERLPEPGVRVLVRGHGGHHHEVVYLDQERDAWYPGGWGVGWTTHWMPLPAPPPEAKCTTE